MSRHKTDTPEQRRKKEMFWRHIRKLENIERAKTEEQRKQDLESKQIELTSKEKKSVKLFLPKNEELIEWTEDGKGTNISTTCTEKLST